MTTKLLFDTLDYARLLKNGDVENADVHAASLAKTLAHNLYTKDEVDMRFEKAINRIDQTLNEFRLLQEKQHSEMREIELRFEKAMNRYLITTISILGSLIVVVGAISTFAHAIFH